MCNTLQWINCGKLFKLVNGTNVPGYVIPGNENVFRRRQRGMFQRSWNKHKARLNGFFNLYVGNRTDLIE